MLQRLRQVCEIRLLCCSCSWLYWVIKMFSLPFKNFQTPGWPYFSQKEMQKFKQSWCGSRSCIYGRGTWSLCRRSLPQSKWVLGCRLELKWGSWWNTIKCQTRQGGGKGRYLCLGSPLTKFLEKFKSSTRSLIFSLGWQDSAWTLSCFVFTERWGGQ